jgi:chorismate mutase
MTSLANIQAKANWTRSDRPFLIAGPCSAETPAQLQATIAGILPHQPDAIRAGIWKPRTRPNTFEGVGPEALLWLKEAVAGTNVPVMVEVASARHVELSLAAGIDMLWIGARTTVNPFMVQEIADALRGTQIPVLVKNPVNPELELWIGALERIHKAGINQLAAIHRGFSGYEKTIYRNHPNWELPIELRRQLPDLMMICDPSHISGNALLVADTAQIALDLDFDGLMIETHIDPAHAWSDASQQITPDQLGRLLQQLVFRREYIEDPVFNSQLQQLRGQIDQIDGELMALLQQRLAIIKHIGGVKMENDITILQPNRWAEIFETRLRDAAQKELDPGFISRLLHLLHQESINTQVKVFREQRLNDRKDS